MALAAPSHPLICDCRPMVRQRCPYVQYILRRISILKIYGINPHQDRRAGLVLALGRTGLPLCPPHDNSG
ncbi:hypothetical protein SXCC_01747 [Gluconacetobacter sp. SXCC-1]|nr:hypothetical protein SXCC_01747 [Gluconacetobacter sp. SXCC-1]